MKAENKLTRRLFFCSKSIKNEDYNYCAHKKTTGDVNKCKQKQKWDIKNAQKNINKNIKTDDLLNEKKKNVDNFIEILYSILMKTIAQTFTPKTNQKQRQTKKY